MLKVMRALQETTVLFQAESVMCIGRAGGGAEILMTPLHLIHSQILPTLLSRIDDRAGFVVVVGFFCVGILFLFLFFFFGCLLVFFPL